MALPRARTEAAVNADIRACPSPCRGREIGWRRGDHRRRHLIARQSRRWGSEHDHFLRNIAKSATPRCAAPGTGASLQIDLRALRETLHHRRPATRPGAHRGRRSRHRQFSACRRDNGHRKAKPKTKTRNHFADPVVRRPIPSFASKDMAFDRVAHALRRGSWAGSLAEIRWPTCDAVTIFSSRAMSDRLVRTPVLCGNCHWPSSRQGAKPRLA
jgi:hypothetical protein